MATRTMRLSRSSLSCLPKRVWAQPTMQAVILLLRGAGTGRRPSSYSNEEGARHRRRRRAPRSGLDGPGSVGAPAGGAVAAPRLARDVDRLLEAPAPLRRGVLEGPRRDDRAGIAAEGVAPPDQLPGPCRFERLLRRLVQAPPVGGIEHAGQIAVGDRDEEVVVIGAGGLRRQRRRGARRHDRRRMARRRFLGGGSGGIGAGFVVGARGRRLA